MTSGGLIHVPPWLPANPIIIILGQSPGVGESRSGIPFTGKVGAELRAWLRAVGVDDVREVAYSNVALDFHPDDHLYKPSAVECVAGYSRFAEEIAGYPLHVPVVLMGDSAVHLAFSGIISKVHGKRVEKRGRGYYASYHPSFVVRQREWRRREQFITSVKAVLARAISEGKGRPHDRALPPVTFWDDTMSSPYLVAGGAIDTETTRGAGDEAGDPRLASLYCLAHAPSSKVTFNPVKVARNADVWVHNHPYDAVVVGEWDARWHCSKLVAAMLGEPDTTLKGLTFKHTGRLPVTYQESLDANGYPDPAYCLADAQNTWEVGPKLLARLPPLTRRLYEELERPLLPLWAKMTMEGFTYLDTPALQEYAAQREVELSAARRQVQEAFPRGRDVKRCGRCGLDEAVKKVGMTCLGDSKHAWMTTYEPDYPVNLNSPTQVQAALTTLGVNARGTAEEVLRPLVAQTPAIGALLDYREREKELGTYVRPWLKVPEGHRLGCVWRPTGVWNGGRVSSAFPNAQNIPPYLEQFFHAGEGHVDLEFDNEQGEVRIAAAVSGDELLRQACLTEDLHSTMMGLLGLTDRRLAKVWVFGSMYGGSEGALVAQAQKDGVQLGYADARMAQRVLREKMPTFFSWADALTGDVVHDPIWGRLYTVPPSANPEHRHRQRVNAPIQGGMGTVTKFQMLALHRAGYEVTRQVHDSVHVRVRVQDEADARVEVKTLMEGCVPDLPVPIVVKCK